MQEWAEFYERLFNFREIRYFDIEGKLTGLKSKAMTSPCGKIRIPINESSDDRSQIQEYLEQYRGEGIQHIALHTADIYKTVDALKVEFLDTPDTYYELSIDATAGSRRAARRAQEAQDPPRRLALRRAAAADLHQDHDRPDLLRDHPAQGRRGLRRGQLQGAVRVDGARPGPPRRAQARPRSEHIPLTKPAATAPAISRSTTAAWEIGL